MFLSYHQISSSQLENEGPHRGSRCGFSCCLTRKTNRIQLVTTTIVFDLLIFTQPVEREQY